MNIVVSSLLIFIIFVYKVIKLCFPGSKVSVMSFSRKNFPFFKDILLFLPLNRKTLVKYVGYSSTRLEKINKTKNKGANSNDSFIPVIFLVSSSDFLYCFQTFHFKDSSQNNIFFCWFKNILFLWRIFYSRPQQHSITVMLPVLPSKR